MVHRKSLLSAQSAPKADRLAAFSAYVDDVANQKPQAEDKLIMAMNRKSVLRSAQPWLALVLETDTDKKQSPQFRVTVPSESLPPMP